MWVGGASAHGTPRKVELERRSLPQPPIKQVCALLAPDVCCRPRTRTGLATVVIVMSGGFSSMARAGTMSARRRKPTLMT